MLFAAAAALASFDPAANLFQLAAASHARLDKATATITSHTGDPAKPYSISFKVWYERPDKLRATVLNNKSNLRDIVAQDDKLIVWDRNLNQFQSTDRPSDVSVRVAAQTQEANFDNAVFDLFESDGITNQLGQMRTGRNWNWKRSGNGFTLTSSTGGTFQVDIQAKTMRVTGLLAKTQGGYTKTTYQYGSAPKESDYQVAKNAYEVKHLDPLMLPPRYASAQAQRVTEKMFRAYDNLDWIALDIEDKDRSTRILASKKQVRQIDAEADWTYDGKTLMVLDKSKKRWCKTEARPTQVVQAVAAASTRFEPFSRLLLQGQNPLRVMLGRQSTVSLVGSATIDGSACDILEADTKVATISLVVRKSDGRVQSMSTITKTADGDGLAGATRTFKYLPRSAVTAQNAFKVSAPNGWRQLSLEELAPEAVEAG